MNALHLLTLRYLALLELLAIDAIVTFFWSYDCDTYQPLLLELRRAIQGNRNRCYWNLCQDALDSFNPATYLLEGDNEFRFDFVSIYKLTLRSIEIVLNYRSILDERTFYELNNLASDIKEGYLSYSHATKKLYPIRSRHRLAYLYSQEVV